MVSAQLADTKIPISEAEKDLILPILEISSAKWSPAQVCAYTLLIYIMSSAYFI